MISINQNTMFLIVVQVHRRSAGECIKPNIRGNEICWVRLISQICASIQFHIARLLCLITNCLQNHRRSHNRYNSYSKYWKLGFRRAYVYMTFVIKFFSGRNTYIFYLKCRDKGHWRGCVVKYTINAFIVYLFIFHERWVLYKSMCQFSFLKLLHGNKC